MSTFLGMQNNIESFLLRTDISTMVQLAINRAIKKYSKSRFWFDETFSDFFTVQGQWSYSQAALEIPVDIRQIDYMRINVNSVFYEVYQRDIQYIIDANVNSNQGQPIDYAWFDRSVFFYPIPQQIYAIRLFYQKEYATLTLPTDNNDFTNIPEAEELIECEALRWLYEKVILDEEKAMTYRAAAKEALRVLNEVNESMTGINGSIKPTYW